MKTSDIIKLGQMLGFQKMKPSGSWVMFSCPVALYRHEKRSDNRPSFGISSGDSLSYYHCFSCQIVGGIHTLLPLISFYTKKDYLEARNFIARCERMKKKYEDYDAPLFFKLPKMKMLSEESLNGYKSIPIEIRKSLFLTEDLIRDLQLKWDPLSQRIVIPIWDEHGRLVSIKGRYCGNDKVAPRFFVYAGDGAKRSGIFYGMHEKLNPKEHLTLVESESSLWALKSVGLLHNLWCTMGASITKAQLYQLQQVPTSILAFFDNDEAGKGALDTLLKSLKRKDIYYLANYYGCNDPRDLVREGKLKEALKSIEKFVGG